MHDTLNFLARLALCTALAAGAALPFAPPPAQAHEGQPHAVAWPGGNRYERGLRSYSVPDVTLTDAEGRPVRLKALLEGEGPLMLNFIFATCNTICPVTVRVFADVPPRMGAAAKDLRMVSITIDPENDTPATLKAYAKNVGAGANWSFLTGRAEDIARVQRAFDTYNADKMAHEPVTFMRPARSRAWIRIQGFANPDELVREYLKGAV